MVEGVFSHINTDTDYASLLRCVSVEPADAAHFTGLAKVQCPHTVLEAAFTFASRVGISVNQRILEA